MHHNLRILTSFNAYYLFQKIIKKIRNNLFNLEGFDQGFLNCTAPLRQYRPFPRVQPRVIHLRHQVVNDVDASISKNELKMS